MGLVRASVAPMFSVRYTYFSPSLVNLFSLMEVLFISLLAMLTVRYSFLGSQRCSIVATLHTTYFARFMIRERVDRRVPCTPRCFMDADVYNH